MHIDVRSNEYIVFFKRLLDVFIEKQVKGDVKNYRNKYTKSVWLKTYDSDGKTPTAFRLFAPKNDRDFSPAYFWVRWRDAENGKINIPVYAEAFGKALEYIGIIITSEYSGIAYEVKTPLLYKAFCESIDDDISPEPIPETEYYRLGKLVFGDIRLVKGLNRRTQFTFHHTNKSIKLPEDLAELEAEWAQLLEEKKEKIQIQNYPVYALTKISNSLRDSSNTTEYDVYTKNATNYNRLASSLSLDVKLPNSDITVREKYYNNKFDSPEWLKQFFISSFGVNLTIVTSDDQIVLIKKNPFFAKTDRNKLHFGLGVALKYEGETPKDVNLEEFAYDRLKEMHRIDKDEIESLEFYALNFSTLYFGYGAYGYAKLNVSFAELREAYGLSIAPDRFNIVAMPFDLEKIKQFISNDNNPLVNQYTIFGALTSLHLYKGVPLSKISRAFSDEKWSDFLQKIVEDKIDFTLEDLRNL